MDGNRGEVEEERRGSAGLLSEPADGAFGEVPHGLRVVAFGRIEAQLAGSGGEFRGAQAEDVMVFDEDAALVIVILRHGELVVEAELKRAGFEFLGEVDARLGAVAEVPFADEAGGVAVLLQQRSDRRTRGFDEERVERVGDTAVVQRRAPAIAAGDECIAGGRADGGRRVGFGEAPALAGEAVEVGRADEPGIGTVGTEAAVAIIVAEDDDDVGRGGSPRNGGG